MRIIVTGSSGLVGHAIQEIAQNKDYVSHEFFYLTSKDCDLRDFSNTLELFKSFHSIDAVIHLAANVGGLFKNMKQKVQMLEDNIYINTNVIKISHLCHIHTFIGILSTCIFPDDVQYPITEHTLHDGAPHDSNAEYAYAKRMMDIQCQAYRTQYNRNYFCITPTNIFGPYDNFNIDTGHVIPSLIKKCYDAKKQNIPFQVFGTGRPLRQFIFSYDLAKIILYLLFHCHEKISHHIIVSPCEEYSIEYVAEKICSILEYDNIIFDSNYSDGQYKKTVSNEYLKTIFPEITFSSFDESLEQTILWYLHQVN